MKYKLLGVFVCLVSLGAALLGLVMTDDQKDRYHQHLEAEEKVACTHPDVGLCTHLPLLSIDTDGVEIPGEILRDAAGNTVRDPDTGHSLKTMAADGEMTILAHLDVIDREGKNNHYSDAPTHESEIRFRIRGNSSRFFDKKNYLIRLVDGEGMNAPYPMLGMDAHHEWALHGPILDKTLIRNYVFYNLAGEVMDYAPNVRFCELVVNGEYMGLYLLTETVTAGEDGARLDIKVSEKNVSYSGYLLRLDRGSSNPVANVKSHSRYIFAASSQMDIAYPGSRSLTQEMADSIVKDFSAFEKALYSYDYDTMDYGYRNYIDTMDFVDYFLLNELTSNYDATTYSTYIYKGVDGLYHMCVWDFNNACDNYQEQPIAPTGFKVQSGTWFYMLIKDEIFVETCIDRYYELRETVFSPEYLDRYIDETIAYLGPAIERNFEKWGYTFWDYEDILYPLDRNLTSYEDAVAQLKGFLHQRIDWLDENIHVLRQHCADSAVKVYNENNK